MVTTELLQATDDLSELARQACTCGHLPDVHDESGCWNCECCRVPSPHVSVSDLGHTVLRDLFTN